MATTIPACLALLSDSSGAGRQGIAAWDALAPVPVTAVQRTAIITAILAGTVATKADVLALIATAAVAPVTQKQVYDVMTTGNVVWPTLPPGVLTTTVSVG